LQGDWSSDVCSSDLGLEEQVCVDTQRNAIEAGISLEAGSRSGYLESEIAVCQIAIHRRAGDGGAGQARFHRILNLVDFKVAQQRQLKMKIGLAPPRDARRVEPDLMRTPQRLGVDDLEDVLDRPGRNEIHREPLDRRAEIGDLERAAGHLN